MKTHAAAFAASTTCAVLCDRSQIAQAHVRWRLWAWSYSAPVSALLLLLSLYFYSWLHVYSVKLQETPSLWKASVTKLWKSLWGWGGRCFLGEIYMISDSPCTNGGFLSPVCLLETNNISCTSPFTFPYGISLFESRLCGACCKLPCVMCLFPGAEQNTELRRQVAGCWCLISLSAVFIAWEVSSLSLYRHWEFQVIKINH